MGDSELELEELMRNFSPEDNRTDKVLLYMLTGRNLDNVMKDWIDGRDEINIEMISACYNEDLIQCRKVHLR